MDGQEDGIGIFTWADGSTYNGFWAGGAKSGIGVYRPAATENKRATTPAERHATHPAGVCCCHAQIRARGLGEE